MKILSLVLATFLAGSFAVSANADEMYGMGYDSSSPELGLRAVVDQGIMRLEGLRTDVDFKRDEIDSLRDSYLMLKKNLGHYVYDSETHNMLSIRLAMIEGLFQAAEADKDACYNSIAWRITVGKSINADLDRLPPSEHGSKSDLVNLFEEGLSDVELDVDQFVSGHTLLGTDIMDLEMQMSSMGN